MCSNDLSLGFNAGAHVAPAWHPLPSTTTSFHPYPDPTPLYSSSPNVALIPAEVAAHVRSTWMPTGAGGSTVSCQDCGNQAKKDCGHSRCRTCCRNRGFDCSTHVRSTWVSAARRRERHVTAGASSGSSSGNKKPRICPSAATTSNTSASNTPARSFDTSSSHHQHQEGGLKEGWPGQVREAAVFKCVRVTAVEDGEDEFAYQAVVKIGGHVFKGFLYDQGAHQSRVDGFINLSDLHLGGGGEGRVGGNGASSASPLVDPSVVYGGSGGGGLAGGSSYGNTTL